MAQVSQYAGTPTSDRNTGTGSAYAYQTAKRVPDRLKPKAPEPETKYVYVNNDNSGGGSEHSYSGPSSDDIINKIKSLLNEQTEQSAPSVFCCLVFTVNSAGGFRAPPRIEFCGK